MTSWHGKVVHITDVLAASTGYWWIFRKGPSEKLGKYWGVFIQLFLSRCISPYCSKYGRLSACDQVTDTMWQNAWKKHRYSTFLVKTLNKGGLNFVAPNLLGVCVNKVDPRHWQPRFVMMRTLWSLMTPQVVATTCDAINDGKLGMMTIPGFQRIQFTFL